MDRKNFDHHILAAMADNLGNSLREMARCGHSRSKRATLTEMSIQLSGFKQTLADPQKRQELVTSCQRANRETLKIPANVQFSVPVKLVTAPYPLIWLNQNAQARNLIVYLAGGAFVQRPLKEHWQFLNRLAKAADAEIVVPDYPLAPDHDFKDAYQELLDLYKWLYDQRPVSSIILMGDSSGAGLAAGFCENLAQQGLPQPGRLVLISPWLDLQLGNPLIKKYAAKDRLLDQEGLRALGKLWAGQTDPRDARLSPLYGPVDQLRNVTIYIGTHEIMYPDAIHFTRRLKAAGVNTNTVIGRGMFHSYPLYPIPESEHVIMEMAHDFDQQ